MATKLAVKPSELRNPDKLDKDFLNTLTKFLGRLDAEVAADTIRYVIDDGDAAVLLKLSGIKEAAEALGLWHQTGGVPKYQQACSERVKVYQQGAKAPPGVWVRLGHVMEASRRGANLKAPTAKGWPSWLVELLGDFYRVCANSQAEGTIWSVNDIEAILKAGELPLDLLARAALDREDAHVLRRVSSYGNQSALYKDWPDYLARHPAAVRDALARPDSEGRIHVLRFLGSVGYDFTPVLDLLVEAGTGGSKNVREIALPILNGIRDKARPFIEKALADGDAGQRHEAAQLLWRLFATDAADLLRRHAEQESSERIKQTIEKLLAAPPGHSAEALADLAASLPPIHVAVGVVELPESAKAGLRQYYVEGHERAVKHFEKQQETWKDKPNAPKWLKEAKRPEPIPVAELEKLIAFVEGTLVAIDQLDQRVRAYAWGRPFGDWLAPPEIKLIHVVRFAMALTALRFHPQQERGLWWPTVLDLEAFRGRCPEPFGLRELDAAVAGLPGARPGMIATAYLANNSKYQTFLDWTSEAVWPIFVEQPDVLRDTLQPPVSKTGRPDYSWPERRRNAFRVLAMFPQLPPGFIPLLWDMALGDSKTDRPLAQAALATVPDKASKIIVALGDGRQMARAAAAEWLGKVGDPAAIDPLKEAFRKEKQEVVKGAMMAALDALGADVNEFLDRDTLLTEAQAGLKKKRPKGIEWVPFDRLPALHWEDSGKVVEPEIVQWWLVQGLQQGSPVAGPILRRYLSMVRKHEAAALAKFVLTSWLGQDTRLMSHEEASAKAQVAADQQWALWSKHQYWLDHYKNDKNNLYRQLLSTYSSQFLGSAVAQKGMLALVSAAGDADCVKLCEGYIRKWFGNRLAQCKALVEVLAWIKHPLAIQALLGFATRFRTKAIRQGAEQHIQALADREGWTIDELADRTLPDAGFERPIDEDGKPTGDRAVLLLDYGPRKFTVTLNDDLEPVIATEEGKTVKAPPAPGKNDDADKAKAAKKAFSDAKKVVKEVLKRQAERFYEALCTQRTWRFEDWKRYLADHPIVGKLCVRLAWAAFAPGKEEGAERFLGCFRPMEDGSLTNEQDEAVALPPETLVRLAHTCNTPVELGEAWLRHFADYDVEPAFGQFGRPTYVLPEARQKETEIRDFEGHMLTTFKLRGKATKLGYQRGEAEDGGCFYLYRKPFPSLGLQAIVEFTGSSLPEEDRPAALKDLYFTGIKGDREAAYSWQPNRLRLSKVPLVLLSECYNDVKLLAAEGTGHDPKWQERSYY